MGDPYRARRWRQQGSSGFYADATTGTGAALVGVVAAPPPPDGLTEQSGRRDVLAWVGQDPARAQQVLAWEQARAEPRVSVVEVVARLARRGG